ncbi:MAG TPA: adenine deaminase [Puia sp.]|jgi:adenine deaminase|nr:adenine deaminase [Puia sp.]
MQIIGQLVDILARNIYPAVVTIEAGRIQSITPLSTTTSADAAEPAPILLPDNSPYILPGFVDAHVHIESSLLIPVEFARLAVTHGTVATVSDPHEIANVCGLPGVEFMIRNGNSVPFYFNFGAPSCVPATRFETAGATLEAAKVAQLLARDEIKYLSEMMNFPGVLHKDPEVMAKIHAAQRAGKPIDGHAPGLRGEQARQYINAGISTDHECTTAEEALDKLRAGMQILIREGSAARNFEALIGLLNDYPNQMMLCTDDCHPDYLIAGHINRLCARAVAKGVDVFKVLRAACVNPVIHYRLDTGLLRPGHTADLILVEDLVDFRVIQTIIRGQVVAGDGVSFIVSRDPLTGSTIAPEPINQWNCNPHTPGDFAYNLNKWGDEENIEQVYVIEALDGQLITNKLIVPVADCLPADGRLHANPEKDLLKIVVVNRYQPNRPVAKSFIRGFGLRRGALASSVAHDSHNIVAVGTDDESICRAVNLVIAHQGGLSCVDPGDGNGTSGNSGTSANPGGPTETILPLPVGGLMSLDEGHRVAGAYTAIDRLAKGLGSPLAAPFMTLSFMALLVIPHLKLSDMGLFDGDTFALL